MPCIIFDLSLIDSEEKLVYMQSMDEIAEALSTAALPPRAYLGAAVSAHCASFSVPLHRSAFEWDFKAEHEGEHKEIDTEQKDIIHTAAMTVAMCLIKDITATNSLL